MKRLLTAPLRPPRRAAYRKPPPPPPCRCREPWAVECSQVTFILTFGKMGKCADPGRPVVSLEEAARRHACGGRCRRGATLGGGV